MLSYKLGETNFWTNSSTIAVALYSKTLFLGHDTDKYGKGALFHVLIQDLIPSTVWLSHLHPSFSTGDDFVPLLCPTREHKEMSVVILVVTLANGIPLASSG